MRLTGPGNWPRKSGPKSGACNRLGRLYPSREFILPIKAITFDFWSTLYRSKSVDFTERLVRLKTSVEQRSNVNFELEQFKEAVQVARETWSRVWREEHRTISAEGWLQVMLAELSLSLQDEQLFELALRMENSVLTDLPTLQPDAKAVLAELSVDYALGLISDTGITPGRVLRQILVRDGILNYFSHLTFSDEVGRSKPHHEAFLSTLTGLAVEPEEAVHIGDLLRTDIAGAKAVGMRAVQYIGINQDGEIDLPEAPLLQVRPDAVITSHHELKPWLELWNGNGS